MNHKRFEEIGEAIATKIRLRWQLAYNNIRRCVIKSMDGEAYDAVIKPGGEGYANLVKCESLRWDFGESETD